MSPNHNLRLIHFIQNGAFEIPNWTSVGAVIGRPTKKAKKATNDRHYENFFHTIRCSRLPFSSQRKSFKFRKAPLEGSCRHCRLRGGSLLNFNHTNGRPMVATTHGPLKQQQTPIMQTGDHWSPLRNPHKR